MGILLVEGTEVNGTEEAQALRSGGAEAAWLSIASRCRFAAALVVAAPVECVSHI